MLKSKVHRATVTDSNPDYEGSIALDEELMETAGILPFEKVSVYNVTNGNRFQTYAILAERGSGIVSVNGAAAHLAKTNDIVIIVSYCVLEEMEARAHAPVLVYVDAQNRITNVSAKLGAAI